MKTFKFAGSSAWCFLYQTTNIILNIKPKIYLKAKQLQNNQFIMSEQNSQLNESLGIE